MAALFSARSFKEDGISAMSCVPVLGIAAGSVALVEALPSTYTAIDISRDQTTSISGDTAEHLSELDCDVEVYLVAEEGSEDEYVERMLDQYAQASDRVTVEQVDPALHPTFTDQYTSEDVADGSIIVVVDDASRVVSSSDLYTLDYSTFSYEFAGESAITSAIIALTSEDLPVVYVTSGHGEASLPSGTASSLETSNYTTETLNLLSVETVPDDADAVLIYAPTSDLTQEEHDKLLAYLEEVGSLMLITSYDFSAESIPNIADIMNAYGLEATEGVVMDDNAGYTIAGYPYYLLPAINSCEITSDLSGANVYVLFPLAHGISEIDSYRSTLDIQSLLVTSSSAYVKTDIENSDTLAQEDGDIAGQTAVGMAVSEEVGDDQTRVVWYSTEQFLADEIDYQVGGYNTTLFIDSLSWLAGAEDISTRLFSKGYGMSLITVDVVHDGLWTYVSYLRRKTKSIHSRCRIEASRGRGYILLDRPEENDAEPDGKEAQV